MKVLWLVSWYPNQLNPLNGDFVQRHAEAVSQFHTVDIIHLCRDENAVVTKNKHTAYFKKENSTEKIIYYHSLKTGIRIADRFFSSLLYRKLYKRAIKEYISSYGLPALVHVHVTMNAGLIALWMKKKYGVKYVVTEHASQLLPEATNNFYQQPVFYRRAWKKVMRYADGLSVVSKYLGDTIAKNILDKAYRVIPNVVNTTIFKLVEKRGRDKIRFIYIARIDYQKNPEAVFKAFSLLKNVNSSFELITVTDETEKIHQLIQAFQLEEHVVNCTEIPQAELVKLIQQSDALILYSRYETFGCVVAEANACGVPVIVSDIPTLHELVAEKENGLFAASENAEALAQKLQWFMENKNSFNPQQIANHAYARYNYKIIGEEFSNWYNDIMNK